MKKLLFLIPLFTLALFAEGPKFKMKDTAIQQENENIYQDLRTLRNGTIHNQSTNQPNAVFNVSSGTILGPLTVQEGAISIRVGADSAGGNEITDATNKGGRIACPHYTNSQEPGAVLHFFNSSTGFTVNIGGGSSALNAATAVQVYGAADTTTTSGSIIARFAGTGEITQPIQPSFLAYNTATDADQTGNSALATVDYDTERYDLGADFASDTFTAPVTGKYYFDTSILLDQTNTGATSVLYIITSNKTYLIYELLPAVGNSFGQQLSVLCDMDANDTAVINVRIAGMAGNTADIYGEVNSVYTFFSGSLIN